MHVCVFDDGDCVLTVCVPGPTTFCDAVALVKQFFPGGVCGPDSAVASDYGVNPFNKGLND